MARTLALLGGPGYLCWCGPGILDLGQGAPDRRDGVEENTTDAGDDAWQPARPSCERDPERVRCDAPDAGLDAGRDEHTPDTADDTRDVAADDTRDVAADDTRDDARDDATAADTPVCGDGLVEGDEQCDDDNQQLEACPYNESSCTVCGPDCTSVPGTVAFCGDDTVQSAHGEACDDGNTNRELGKVTAFVVSKDKQRELLVFEHPMAGIQLPAGTVEHGEDAAAAAAREVFEETGLEVTSQGIVLDEQVRPFGPERAAMLETVTTDKATFQHGHKVRVLGEDEASASVQIREEIYDYNVSPPELLSATTDTAFKIWQHAELQLFDLDVLLVLSSPEMTSTLGLLAPTRTRLPAPPQQILREHFCQLASAPQPASNLLESDDVLVTINRRNRLDVHHLDVKLARLDAHLDRLLQTTQTRPPLWKDVVRQVIREHEQTRVLEHFE